MRIRPRRRFTLMRLAEAAMPRIILFLAMKRPDKRQADDPARCLSHFSPRHGSLFAAARRTAISLTGAAARFVVDIFTSRCARAAERRAVFPMPAHAPAHYFLISPRNDRHDLRRALSRRLADRERRQVTLGKKRNKHYMLDGLIKSRLLSK